MMMNDFLEKKFAICVLFLILCFSFSQATAQKRNIKVRQQLTEQAEQKSPFASYHEVITDEAETQRGLFTVHKVINNYYFELPETILEKEIVIVSRMSGIPHQFSPYGAGIYTRLGEPQVVKFERNGNWILMRLVAYKDVATKNLSIFDAIKRNNFEAIIYRFTIEAIGDSWSSYVIDVTDFFTSDVPLIGVKNHELGITNVDKSRSFITCVKAYQQNVEIRHVLTYRASKEDRSNSLSFEMNQSMALLPEDPMTPRLHSNHVNYQTIKHVDYGLREQKATEMAYILRWRLEPSDWEDFNRGALVEPVKPIVYYVDPALPEKWRPYIKQGVEDWQKIFEKVGFKNAILVRDFPDKKENPSWDIDDFQYSVIRFVANEKSVGAGFTVYDPRTGEILKADIQYGINHLNYIRKIFFIQTAGANPDARCVKFKDEVMGELIRSVIAHEVGHTLGLAHNFDANLAYPVDSLRSRSFTTSHGNSASIMDYAFGNYVAQPEDSIRNFYNRIGAYDHWAIKYGYHPIPGIDKPDEEKEMLNQWITEQEDNTFLRFPKGMESYMDLGDDPIIASEYGIRNLQRIVKNLVQWTSREDKGFGNLKELYEEAFKQFENYIEPVQLTVGGYYTNKASHDDDLVYNFSAEKQKKAVAFLNKHVFQTPDWLMEKEILEKVSGGPYGIRPHDLILSIQRNTLTSLMGKNLKSIIQNEGLNGENVYSTLELFTDLRMGIFTELYTGVPIDIYRRNLQKVTVEIFGNLVTSKQEYNHSDASSVALLNLISLKREIENDTSGERDTISNYHLQHLITRINTIISAE